MAKFVFDVPNMPVELKEQVENVINDTLRTGRDIDTSNMNAFSNWLNKKNPGLYRKVKPYIDAIYEAIKKAGNTLEEIAEGTVLGVAGAATAPIVGVYVGVKEGLENGLEAGVKEGFKAMGKYLDDLFS